MREIPRDLQSLIEASRGADRPNPADRQRVQLALAAKLGNAALGAHGVVSATAASTSIAPAASAAAVGLIAKLLLVGVVGVVAAGAVAAVALSHSHQPQTRLATSTPRPVSRIAPPEHAAITNVALPSDPAVQDAPAGPRPAAPIRTPRRSTVSVTPHEHIETLAPEEAAPEVQLPAVAIEPSPAVNAEVIALAGAQHALRAGDAATALQRLDEYAAQFPHGALREEHRAARVLTLCALGRRAEARAEAQSFLQDAAQSPLAARVRASCAGTE